MEQSWMYITVELQALHSQSYLEELVHSKSRVRSPVCHNFEESDDQGLPVCAPGVSRMKPVPIALLLAAVLLTTHIPLSVCRPRDLSVVDDRGYKKQLDEVLLRAGDSAVSYLLGEKLLQYLQQRKPAAHRSAPLNPPVPVELDLGLGQGQGQGLGLGLSAETPQRGRWREVEGGSQEELVGFSKRNEEPPISIDLTFHLLRNMIEMARIENQREQAELNRKYLDEVGK